MDEDYYDPLSHLSTALSFLPRTLAGVGCPLPGGLSEADQITAFFAHMHGLLNKDQKSGKERIEKHPCPNPNATEKERDGAGKGPLERQQQAFLEPMQQRSTRSYESKPSPNPVTIVRDETGKSFEGKLQDVKLEPSEPMQLEQPHTNNYERESPHSDRLQVGSCETRNCSSQEKNRDNEIMEPQPKPSISSLEDKPISKANKIAAENDEPRKDIYQGYNRDTSFESLRAITTAPRTSIIGSAIENRCLTLGNTEAETAKNENISFDGQHQDCFESVEFTEMVQQPSNIIHVNNWSPSPDSMVLDKETPRKINFEGESNLNFRSVASMHKLESRRSIHIQVIDNTEIERDIRERSGSHSKHMVENKRIYHRPGLGLDYNISPFTVIQKTILQTDRDEKAKQVLPVDFTVLDHISDPDAFTKKVYELKAAVAEIKRLGGEPKIIGQRVFKMLEDDQPRRRRPGLGLQMPQPEFVLLPMRPLPAKVKCACASYNQNPTESTSSPEKSKEKMLSGSQNEAPSNISNATKEVPEMNLYASSSAQRLLSVLESWSDKEEAVAMVYDCLNLQQTVIPEMPKFSRLDVVKSPWSWRQLPSVERVRDIRGEDSLDVLEELKTRFFTKSSAAYCSDDDTNSLAGVGSIRSLSTSPGCRFSFENEDIETPYAGPSASPFIEIEELSSQEKVPEMTSEAGGDAGGITSDEDIVDDDIADEPEMGSPWENSPVNIEVAVSPMPLENSPVNAEEVTRKEASSEKGKKRTLEDADSSLDVHSTIPTPTPDSNDEPSAIAETSLLEPLTERNEEVAPPKKKNRKQKKGKENIQIVDGGLREVDGLRRSTRIRSRPLRSWMGERFLYARIGNNFPTAVGVKEVSPATVGMRVKVKSFVSPQHADLVKRLA